MAHNELLGTAFCKGKLSSGSKPQPHRASAQVINTSCFYPGPPLSIGQSGAGPPLAPWALLLYWGSLAPKSHSPRILLRGECRIGCAKGFCAQAPAMPPEPARPLSAEDPWQLRPKTSFWELHSAKGNSPRAANHSLTVPRRRKSTQAVFAPGPPLSIGRS